MLLTSKEIILKFFKDNPTFDYTIRDIVRNTGIVHKIAKPIIIDMEKDGEITKVRFSKCSDINFVYTYQLTGWIDEQRKQELDRNYNMELVSEVINGYRRRWTNNRIL